MDIIEFILLLLAGLITGVIDSVVGGGGLITVPLLSVLIGPGATAIGTNKVAAVCSSAFALFVYLRGGLVRIHGAKKFVVLTGLGAFIGARLAPFVPPESYRILLLIICPLMLFVVFKKDLWSKPVDGASQHPTLILLAAGLFAGFYDGIAGPGGGTLMFLTLFVGAKIPLLTAMATAKLANLASASTSLASFISTGHVIWTKGLPLALGISVGAWVGATYATQDAPKYARAALLFVSVLLMIRLILS